MRFRLKRFIFEVNPARKRLQPIALCLFAALCALSVSAGKYIEGDIGYYNSDATWHTLLTIEAYTETPAEVHRFVPIVSFGGESDKGIPWGANISDELGNYYYTSFSAAGFIAPYLFFTVFDLSLNEASLYFFNTLLFALSACFWTLLLYLCFAQSNYRFLVVVVGVLAYCTAPELLHGMGIVYWHQSLMQVVLSAQLLLFFVVMRGGQETSAPRAVSAVVHSCSLHRMDRLSF